MADEEEIPRTPFVRWLPPYGVDGETPERSPVVNGVISQPLADLIFNERLDPEKEDIESAIQQVQCGADPKKFPQENFEAMIQNSLVFFCTEMLRGPEEAPYYGKFIVAPFHEQIDEAINSSEKILIQAARDHGKSHLLSIGYTLWRGWYKKPGKRIDLFGSTQPLAEEMLELVKEELLNNTKLEFMLPASRDQGWSKRRIKLKNGTKIYARGINTKARGGHPYTICCDDILSDEDLYSETIRGRHIEYFTSKISNMLVPGGQMIVVGTPFAQQDLYHHLEKTGLYCVLKFPAIDKQGKILFPERYSVERLEQKKKEMGSAARFAREFLVQPLSDESSLFPSWLFAGEVRVPYVLGLPYSYWEERRCVLYTGVDIAEAPLENEGDWFVIFTIALDPMGVRWIANIRRSRGLGFQQQLDQIKDEYTIYRSAVIHIEANAAQRIFSDEVLRTTNLPVRPFFTLGQQPKSPWRAGMRSVSMSKHHWDLGVPSLRLSLENKKWRMPRGDENSIKMTDIWMGELQALSWQGGKVVSVGDHDDIGMACLPPGQLVTTKSGLVEIEKIQVGDFVLTHRGKWQRVKSTMGRPYNGTVYKIKPAGITEPIFVTEDHPIGAAKTIRSPKKDNFRIKPDRWEWVLPSTLKAGRRTKGMFMLGPSVNDREVWASIDMAEFARKRKPAGRGTWHIEEDVVWWRHDRRIMRRIPFDENFGLLVGLYLAEGTLSPNKSSVTFCINQNETYIEEFIRSASGRYFSTPVTASPSKNDAGMSVRFTSSIAHDLFGLFGKGQSRHLPWEWLGLPDVFLGGVLRGWLVGDGSRSRNGLRGNTSVRDLAEQIRLIAIRLGLRVCICQANQESSNFRSGPAWSLSIEPVSVIKLIGVGTTMEKERWGTFPTPRRFPNARTMPINAGLAHRIASVQKIHYKGMVHNLGVENDESYVVQGVTVHNCWIADVGCRLGGMADLNIEPAETKKEPVTQHPIVKDSKEVASEKVDSYGETAPEEKPEDWQPSQGIPTAADLGYG